MNVTYRKKRALPVLGIEWMVGDDHQEKSQSLVQHHQYNHPVYVCRLLSEALHKGCAHLDTDAVNSYLAVVGDAVSAAAVTAVGPPPTVAVAAVVVAVGTEAAAGLMLVLAVL